VACVGSALWCLWHCQESFQGEFGCRMARLDLPWSVRKLLVATYYYYHYYYWWPPTTIVIIGTIFINGGHLLLLMCGSPMAGEETIGGHLSPCRGRTHRNLKKSAGELEKRTVLHHRILALHAHLLRIPCTLGLHGRLALLGQPLGSKQTIGTRNYIRAFP